MIELGIMYNESHQLKLQDYNDADRDASEDSRKLTSSYIFALVDDTVTWRSKRQPMIDTSTMK